MSVVLDWDGTVTERDTLVMVLEEFGDPVVYRRAAAALEREEITLNEEIRQQFAAVTAPLDVVVRWLLERVRIRPGFAELVRAHDATVLTSGFHELIDPLLARENVTVDVLANSVEAATAEGWRIRFRDEVACATCGQPCKRAALPDGHVVYVGDGYSDRCAALAADRVFARDELADYLDERGVRFERYADLHDVRRALAAPA
jgi:2-hydroxy-3-keto-5-methylthiopentenyl-1-phosphate phosphatase